MVIQNNFKFILVGIILLNILLPVCVTAEQQTDFFLEAEKYEIEVGKEFNVYVKGKNIEDIYAFELELIFDSKKLGLVKAKKTNEGYSSYNESDENKIHFVFTKIGDVAPLKGDVDLCQFTFKMLESSETSIELESIRIVSSEIIDTKIGDLESVDTKKTFDDNEISVKGVLESEEKPPSPGNGGSYVPSDDKGQDKDDKDSDKDDKDLDEDGEKTEEPEEIPSGIIFTDIDNHWSKEFALKLIDLGVLTGYPDNTLRPDQKITRAEGVVLLVNTLGLDVLEGDVSFYDGDIIPTWCKNHVKVASEKNILTGYEDNTFRPFNNLTRAEMVVLIMNAFEYEKVEFDQSKFADGDVIPGWAADFIAGAVKEGIVAGYPDNTFKPTNEVTRGEVFALIANCIE